MARILVVSSDILPVEGQPTTGAGLRAWGLGKGLQSYGHEVEFSFEREVAQKCGYEGNEVRLFDTDNLDSLVAKIDPDILLFQHWTMSLLLNERPKGYVVIDFHGPALLEILFRHPPSVEKFARQKLNAIARADYFTCAGNKQLHYFLAWLLLAGIDLHEFPISSIPFSMPSESPNHTSWPTNPTFVYGGVFLPWTDPALGLTILVQEMEQLSKGELKFFGGKHPWANLPSEKEFENLRTKLTQSERVRFFPAVPRDELIQEYATASVAWDLMARNPERELAFTSRTVEYLWCGLPVVYNNYAELADYINEYDAGWTVDPSDQEQIRKIVREILNCPESVRRKGENAQRLVRDHLSWEHTVKPLADYCTHPYSARRLSETPLIRSIEDCGFSAETLALMSRFKAKVPGPVKRLAKTLVRRRSIDKKT
jgi:glycosyltransferase involved in cell wall biosynthesis